MSSHNEYEDHVIGAGQAQEDQSAQRRKRYCLFGTIGVLAVALIIVLVVVLGNNGGGDKPGPPGPGPGPTPIPSGDNPYVVDTNVDNEYKQSGVLKIKDSNVLA
jgi:hypothetical protein